MSKEKYIYAKEVDSSLMRHNIFQFREAALHLSEPHRMSETNVVKVLFVPECVLLTFTIEIELKYISLKEKGRFMFCHDLKKLFDDLPDNLLNTILTSKSGEYIQKSVSNFENYFTNVRYDFQNGHSLGVDALNFFTAFEPVLYMIVKQYD